jgi:hypothetical protein
MKVLKFFGVLTLGIVIGAGGLILLVRSGVIPSAADNYNACLQDAKIGMWEHSADINNWFPKALAKCAKQYRIDRENGR